MTVSDLLEQPCNKSDTINKLVTEYCITTCFKLVDNLEQAVWTRHVDSLFANLLQVMRYLCV